MCGLIGGTGNIESRYLVALGCLAESRGSDSAGVAWQAGNLLRVAKVAKNPLVAYPVDLAPAIRHASKYHAPIIGHTRQATQGAITARNAHPFKDDKLGIAWAHNGIITNDAQFGKFEVDSECLIGGIEKRNFSAYAGSISLLWIEEGKLHAFRKNNPLYRGSKRGAVYLASTEAMLQAIGCHKIKELSEGFMYVWDGGRLASTTKVPVHEYTRQGGRWQHDDFQSEFGCGYRPGSYVEGHRYYRGNTWHNHLTTVQWANDCSGCNPAGNHKGPKVEIMDDGKVITDGKQTATIKHTDLMPIRHGGTADESAIQRVEGEEAARMMDEENLCHKCKVAPRTNHFTWCDECLGIFQHGWES